MNSLTEFLPLLGSGLLVTLLLAGVSTVCGSLLGFIIAYFRIRHYRILSVLIDLFTDVFRCVPPIVILFILYYGLPFTHGGITLSAFAASWLGLSLVFAASSVKIFESCLQSKRDGLEAASKDWSSRSSITGIMRTSAPDLMLEAVEIVKHTALASFIVVPELFYSAKVWNASTLSGTPYLAAGLVYFLVLWPLLRISDRLRHA